MTPPTQELTTADVEAYTSGRLAATDPQTQRILDAALGAVRREAGWHVCPVRTDTLTLDGPSGWGGKRVLSLPTLNIVTITSITNAGNPVDLSTVVQSAQVGWLIKLTTGRWSNDWSSIVITLDHGFPPDEAADWREAVLTMIDDFTSIMVTGRPDSDLASKQVDDVVYKWGTVQGLPGAPPILEKYWLPNRGFA